MNKVIAIAYTVKETGDLTLRVLNLEEIGDLHEEVFGQRESFKKEPLDVCESILEKMQAKHEIYGDYVAQGIEWKM